MKLPYWTKSNGIKGRIEKPEDFVVKEILHRKYFTKYKTSGNVKKSEGRYNLFLLRKKGMTTHKALQIISKRFNSKIGFAGLKDKFAVTEQYITMRNGENFAENGIELTKTGTTDRMLSKGDLIGNEFTIILRECRNIENLPQIIAEINKGFPNYFGPQRFGIYGNNHVIGRMIVKRQFAKALELINKSSGNYKDISRIPKERLKFFVNAYQAWIFNELLSEYVKKRKYFSGYLPIVGYTKIRSAIMKMKGIRPRDFRIDELRLACLGSKRKAFIKTHIDYNSSEDTAQLKFSLPAGSYATVVIREICKGSFQLEM